MTQSADSVFLLWLKHTDRWLLNKRPLREALAAKLDAVIGRYLEPHRRYHNLDHLAFMFSALAEHERHFSFSPSSWVAIELAIMYHDSVYVVGDSSRSPGANEWDSAAYAMSDLADIGFSSSMSKMVGRIILNTRCHTCEAWDRASKLVIDLDLLALGDVALYWPNNRRIREEYGVYDDDAFCKGRMEFLRTFLKRRRIFHSRHFAEPYERVARLNMSQELKALEAGGKPWMETR